MRHFLTETYNVIVLSTLCVDSLQNGQKKFENTRISKTNLHFHKAFSRTSFSQIQKFIVETTLA